MPHVQNKVQTAGGWSPRDAESPAPRNSFTLVTLEDDTLWRPAHDHERLAFGIVRGSEGRVSARVEGGGEADKGKGGGGTADVIMARTAGA